MTPTRTEYPPIPTTECWLYPFAVNQRGYARIWTGSLSDGTQALKYAHRVAWEMAEGPIPDGMTVDHLCFTKTCVRVDHMELVSVAENAARQRRARKTHCVNGHPLSGDNLLGGTRWRKCKTCHREGARSRAVPASPRPPATHCRKGHEWTPGNTYIRPDTGTRECRTCAAARQQGGDSGRATGV